MPPAKEITEAAAAIASLQVRSGQLSSYKGLALQRSRWPIGALRDDALETIETIGFYRIIGNPLPPRHDADQLHRNLGYILDREPRLQRARKIFVLNRLNASLEEQVRRQILSYGYEVVVVEFDNEEYRPYQMADTYGLHPAEWGDLLTPKFAQINQNLYVINNNGARNAVLRDGLRRGWAWTLPFDGNCFFTRARWDALVAELDEAARRKKRYAAIPMVRTFVASGETARNASNDAPPGLVANDDLGEPQIAFSRDAELHFTPTVPYGHRPKVNLLWQLGVRGVWDSWNHDTVYRAEGKCVYLGKKKKANPPSVCRRTVPTVHRAAARATVPTKATILRLPDVRSKAESAAAHGDTYKSRQHRRNLRDLAVARKIADVDRLLPASTHGPDKFVKPMFFNVYSMESMRRECIVYESELRDAWSTSDASTRDDDESARPGDVEQHHCAQIRSMIRLAQELLHHREMSVVDKMRAVHTDRGSSCSSPNASAHHFQNVGPYDWRLSELPDDFDVNHIQILSLSSSNHRNSGASLEKVADLKAKLLDGAYRRERSTEFVRWDGHLRPDGRIWGPGADSCDRTRAYEMVTNVTLFALAHFYTGDRRFSDKATRLFRTWFLDPTTRMLPTIKYSHWSRPSEHMFGSFQLKELTYALDALSLLRRTKSWSSADDDGMSKWCLAYLDSLSASRALSMKGHHSWWCMLQSVALGRCARQDGVDDLRRLLREQVDSHITPRHVNKDGVLPNEISRTRSLQNHFTATYAMVLAWRALLNVGESTAAATLAASLRRTVSMIDDLLSWPDFAKSCSTHPDERPPTDRPRLHQDLCSIGLRRAVELATPLCQWAFDFDAAFGGARSTCRRPQPASPQRRGELSTPPLPTDSLEQFRWPPLLPSDPNTNLFPFQSMMW